MTVKEFKEMVNTIPEKYDDRKIYAIKCADSYAINIAINGYFMTSIDDTDVLALTNINVVPRNEE